MIRKLLLVGLAAAFAVALSASAATAEQPGPVHVENPGTHETAPELALSVVAHVGGGMEVPALSCDNDWEILINEDGSGEIAVHDIIPHAGDTGACDTAQACDGLHWPFQIVENETGAEFGLHTTFCLENTGTFLDGVQVPVECDAFSTETHCDQFIGIHPDLGVPMEVQGEATYEDLGLMHG